MNRQEAPKSLFVRFFLLFAIVGTVILAAYLAWFWSSLGSQNEQRALAEARVLAAEAKAAWDYVDSIQNRLNYTHGEFNFKGVYCAVAAKGIARNFSKNSDYSVRYVREDPRSLDDIPDAFELEALRSFEAGGEGEYYSMVWDGGTACFCYVAKLEIERGCLSCHGETAGEKDVTGYIKEGMSIGDIGGAISIAIPMDFIVSNERDSLVGAVVFFCALMVAMAAALGWGLRRWAAVPILQENARLYRESEDQSNFLTIMTHELKTPLSSILAFTELWKRHSAQRDPEEAMLVEEVETSGTVLLGMINNVLDTAKLEAGTMELSRDELDVHDLATQLKSTMGPIARKRGIDLAIVVERTVPIVCADGEVLRRIAVNLVSNALRFTPQGGSVAVFFCYEEGCLFVRVSDSGVGIPSERVPFIFDRFESAPSSATTSEGGTGLGLSIVKNFTDMMGGKITVESTIGVGSTFVVILPLPAFGHLDEGEERYGEGPRYGETRSGRAPSSRVDCR